jgi:predicted nucleic acid-binding protein
LKLVLDAEVLIGALDGADARHAQSRALLTVWHEQDATQLLSVVNLSEVLVAPAADRKRLRAARAAIAALGVAIHSPNAAIGVDAARLRARHPISLPDAYCLATARHTGSLVASFDRKLLRVAEAEEIAHAESPE